MINYFQKIIKHIKNGTFLKVIKRYTLTKIRSVNRDVYNKYKYGNKAPLYAERIWVKPEAVNNFIHPKKTLLEQFKQFNNHPEAEEKIKEWEEKVKPYEKDKIYRQALLFLKDECRPPGDSIEDKVKFLKDNLPYRDAVKIFNKGVELSSVSGQLGKQNEDS